MSNRQPEQPGIGDLSVPEQLLGVEVFAVEQAQIAGHKQMVAGLIASRSRCATRAAGNAFG